MKKAKRIFTFMFLTLFMIGTFGFTTAAADDINENCSGNIDCCLFNSNLIPIGENEVHEIDSYLDDLVFICDIDEYVALLNAGLVTPRNVTTTYHLMQSVEIDEFDLSDTDTSSSIASIPSCSNIFGHSWTAWSDWVSAPVFHRPGQQTCLTSISRFRHCTRTHCGIIVIEIINGWKFCWC
jgi:hypothetical protein